MVRCSFAKGLGNYEFIFASIPPWAKDRYRKIRRGIDKPDIFRHYPRFDDRSVFIGVTDFIECPKGRIPSLVWLERSKKRFDLIGHMLAMASEGGITVSLSVSEGERGMLFLYGSNDYRRSRVIQGRSKTFDGLNGKPRKLSRQTLLESDFVDCVRSMRIKLGNSHASVSLKEVAKEKVSCLFQLSGMFLCPVDPLISSGKSG